MKRNSRWFSPPLYKKQGGLFKNFFIFHKTQKKASLKENEWGREKEIVVKKLNKELYQDQSQKKNKN